ncbi:hypothetical protein V1478_007425, partial [Vespula squamosa]
TPHIREKGRRRRRRSYGAFYFNGYSRKRLLIFCEGENKEKGSSSFVQSRDMKNTKSEVPTYKKNKKKTRKEGRKEGRRRKKAFSFCEERFKEGAAVDDPRATQQRAEGLACARALDYPSPSKDNDL